MPVTRFPLVSLLASALVLAGAAPGQLRAQQANPPVRVLLLETVKLTLAAPQQPLVLRAGSQRWSLAPLEPVVLQLAAGSLVLERAGGVERLPAVRELWLEPAAQSAVPPLDLQLSPQEGADFQLQQRGYRGRLQVLVGSSALQAVNHVPLEAYLPSVVASEMPASWPQAALRAQAVAARTYALRQRKPAAAFDVSATVSSQVYKGVEAETPSTRQAVISTRGQVLMFGPSLANTVFHSSAGGSTENSGDLWSQQLPYLVSVPDFDQHSPVHAWQLRLEPEQLQKAFGEIGGAQRIDVLATTGSGRVRQARVTGPAGTLVLTGAQLRSRLGLKSTMVRFEVLAPELAALPPSLPALPPLMPRAAEQSGADEPAISPDQVPVQLPPPSLLAIGRGFGHGVGMSQWGAHGLANRGQSYEQILHHYYRGTELRPYVSP
ncbi:MULTISPECIES: SpoIID/LytB domain-containing protein [unclassified Cyanobium]|uniref:SpoIID/LytB domain-containing protein n=1 Tax=unclassified Cyanobium TaxID=2627006 RepID=UPI0020CC9EF0|nr:MULTISPECIES: SpoIID/LytB domain-containing protein [unclassified Cyanobium]MCP9778684.1 SpoIID/LytB domain-containing protein [Cyanobium sp. Tous-M-B4]MCP9876478.1 SpoIID/LytB domain-containing protein [Cyanobium sp. A2C-AMD]